MNTLVRRYRRRVLDAAREVENALLDIAYWDAHGWPQQIPRQRKLDRIADAVARAFSAAAQAAKAAQA